MARASISAGTSHANRPWSLGALLSVKAVAHVAADETKMPYQISPPSPVGPLLDQVTSTPIPDPTTSDQEMTNAIIRHANHLCCAEPEPRDEPPHALLTSQYETRAKITYSPKRLNDNRLFVEC